MLRCCITSACKAAALAVQFENKIALKDEKKEHSCKLETLLQRSASCGMDLEDTMGHEHSGSFTGRRAKKMTSAHNFFVEAVANREGKERDQGGGASKERDPVMPPGLPLPFRSVRIILDRILQIMPGIFELWLRGSRYRTFL